LKIIQTTKLTPAECATRVQQLIDHMKTKSPDMQVRWDGTFRVCAAGTYNTIPIDAVVNIEPGKVTLEAQDPGRIWRKAAEIYLTSSMKKYLSA
jgi:hypothetical protein